MLKRILRSRRGEGYIDVCVLVLCAMLVIALAVQVLPAFIAKQQLDTFATELVREAEIAGRIGPETDRREQALREQTIYNNMAAALEQARKGRLHILGKLTECIAEPREDYKPCVPRIVQIVIPQDMIGPVIGPGGKVIQDIQKTTNTTITITEVDNKGIVDIFGQDKTALDGALNRIKACLLYTSPSPRD